MCTGAPMFPEQLVDEWLWTNDGVRACGMAIMLPVSVVPESRSEHETTMSRTVQRIRVQLRQRHGGKGWRSSKLAECVTFSTTAAVATPAKITAGHADRVIIQTAAEACRVHGATANSSTTERNHNGLASRGNGAIGRSCRRVEQPQLPLGLLRIKPPLLPSTALMQPQSPSCRFHVRVSAHSNSAPLPFPFPGANTFSHHLLPLPPRIILFC
ncbi:hypothetical protein BCV70DRAFT_96220 [Testicularia cyperi]|uniref:Uncharacterized protein n=1 Tax=Testicularia cyperi TaxID=1882483 RepID=A0A317XT49_9BASI|nr:hypothetical protein BCV70DRAFT_96220 [Testicularia cyperi]